MARNGSGTMSIDYADFQSGANIVADELDANFSTIVAEITNSVAVDGQSTMSGDLAMGTHKITGMGNPTSAQDAATKAYVDANASDQTARDMAASALAYTLAQNDATSITGSIGRFYLSDDFESDSLATKTNSTYDAAGDYYGNPSSYTKSSSQDDWGGNTAEYTFPGDDVEVAANDNGIYLLDQFLGDFSFTFTYKTDEPTISQIGLFRAADKGSFNTGGSAQSFAGWYWSNHTSSNYLVDYAAGAASIYNTVAFDMTSSVADGSVITFRRVGTSISVEVNGATVHTFATTSSETLQIWVGQAMGATGHILDVSWYSVGGGKEIDRTAGTAFGDLSSGGGLAAAFDGETSETLANSAKQSGESFATGYIGKDYGAGNEKVIVGARAWNPTNDDGGSGSPNATTVYLYASNTAPANSTDGTLLGTVGTFANGAYGRVISNNFVNATAYRYVWLSMNASYASTMYSIAEAKFLEVVEGGDMTLAPTPVTLATANPSDLVAYIIIDPVDAITVGTDIVMTMSIDGGTTDATGTWTKVGDIGAEELYRVEADVSAQTGSSLTYEITTANLKEIQYHDCVGIVAIY